MWMYYDDRAAPPEGEEWRQIPVEGVQGEASSLGRIRAPKGTITHGQLRNGYYTYKDKAVHRLVALSFPEQCPPEPGCDIVNHKDGNKLNNAAANLEWVTNAANAKHAYDSGLNRKRRGVRQLQPDGSLTQEFGSVTEASEATGTQPSHITECCRGKLRTTGGYRWEYVDPVAETAAYLEELVSTWDPPTQIDPASTKNVPELTEKDLENLLAGLLN